MRLLLVLLPAAAWCSRVRVWDGVLSPTVCRLIINAGNARAHEATSVYDRGAARARGRTVLEAAVTSLLDELGDDSRYVEYWWRSEWKSMRAHRDVDEFVCRARRRGAYGVHRCPDHGHVLYLDIADGARCPTCVWEEEGDARGVEEDGARRGGAPRPVHALRVVPARPRRLLRFRGDMLHAVPRPSLEWLRADDSGGGGDDLGTADGLARAVLLFNTWREPPTLPPPNEPPAAGAEAALAALATTPTASPIASWIAASDLPAVSSPDSIAEEGSALLEAPLLGDEVRRGCASSTIAARADAPSVVAALTAADGVSTVPLFAEKTDEGLGENTEAAVSRDADEEMAMMSGYADHLEAEFFGADDGGDDDDWDDF